MNEKRNRLLKLLYPSGAVINPPAIIWLKNLITLSACLLVATARAEESSQARFANWHHWRGPLANGTAPQADPPITWDEKNNIRWKAPLPGRGRDRKSTRLNSSHSQISYAVFCLKKKTIT